MYNNLHMELRRREITQKEIAGKLGMAERTFSFKLRGKAEFDLEEARKICGILEVSAPEEVVSLFQKD